jgi:hypothetical protein
MQNTAELFEQVARIYNPTGGEHEMLSFIQTWLIKNNIVRKADITTDPSWGLHVSKTYEIPISHPVNDSPKRGIFFCAHTDSDHLPNTIESLKSSPFIFNELTNVISFSDLDGEAGLDDKTGIVAILELLLLLERSQYELDGEHRVKIPIHVFFSVNEEVGQKGMMRMPAKILALVAKDVRYGCLIDRMSSRCNNQRHIVTRYSEVPLTILEDTDTLVNLFSSAMADVEHTDHDIATSDSKYYCSDSMEWRTRIDAEIVAPAYCSRTNNKQLAEMLQEYDQITKKIHKMIDAVDIGERYCWGTERPRLTRYQLVERMRRIMYADDTMQDLYFSVVNFSMHYDEDTKQMNMKELYDTSLIAYHFIHKYADSL